MGTRLAAFALFTLVLAGSAAAACSASPASQTAPPPDAGGAGTAALPALGMNDVSILVPLPSSPAAPGALGPRSSGGKGPLLTQAIYDKAPAFGVVPADGLDYARMRVVGIRFDGCFPRPAGCEAQIRLVMQPITDEGEALDSALHLFYRLTEQELATVVVGLRNLRALAPEQTDAPLDVSPALLAQGMEGPYGVALTELVLAHAGDENLTRMTFFLRAPSKQEEWFLGGFERRGGALEAMTIVGVGKTNQRVNRPAGTEGYQYVFTPSPKTPEDMTVLLTSAGAKAATPDVLQAAIGSLARIENPIKHGPDDLECAGCHVATMVGAYAKTSLALDPADHADAFTSSRDLTLRGKATSTPSSLRAFGWFGKESMIATRVVNETAAVLDDLDARFPAK